MQVSDLVQNGCKLQARIVVQDRGDEYYEKYPSQLFKINDVTFQIQVNVATTAVLFTNLKEHQILINFAKNNNWNYILKFSSKALNIINKSFTNDDGTWCIIHTSHTNRSDFNFTVVLERSYSFASYGITIYDDVLTDFELRCEDGSVKVHKAVLAMASPVLRRQLQLKDWLDNYRGYMFIPVASKETLHNFKDYIYLHVLPDTGVENLLLLASCYMMSDLEQKCIHKLEATATAQNILALLEFSVVHCLTNLQLVLLACVESGGVKVKDLEKEVCDKRAEKFAGNDK